MEQIPGWSYCQGLFHGVCAGSDSVGQLRCVLSLSPLQGELEGSKLDTQLLGSARDYFNTCMTAGQEEPGGGEGGGGGGG